MNEALNIIIAVLLTIGMIAFTGIVMILNNIDEFIDWLDKKINKR